MTRDEARARDAADPLAPVRARFALPDDLLYLDGNSLGQLPLAARMGMRDAVERQWGDRLIRGWNDGWIDAPLRVGARIAPLLGADADEVIAGDSTSTNLFKAIVAALQSLPEERRVVLSEAGNFHTDLHIAEGAVRCVPGARLQVVPRSALGDALDAGPGLLLLTHVHYKTAERFDMAAWTARAHAAGALTLWDLSHSAGAVALDLAGARADLAVGCGYKYLNGGPGAPAFLFVARRHHGRLGNPISGWMGHAAPFAFEDDYRPAEGMKRWLSGTPQVLGLAALEAALSVWDGLDREAVWAKSAALFDLAVAAGDAMGLTCVTPRDPAARGSHISFRLEHAWPVSNALIAAGVVGDFRAPDILRFGLTPLTLRFVDVWDAMDRLRAILADGRWRDRRYQASAAVT